ncbi:hypothetical protein [Pseudoalteromonas denitrificans]|uniref:Outer membrane lipoprotein SlyB n=1 Tax=Pseudoalteromonas denitrificans DSM 6059 TaxID=1123010 RepID=A0A1I1EQ24_9GAMM|nr:hypothetical protein [Pseudoalteromonas denitrificans]SFB87030.1 hypothetical protein SAMN02745724_00302 [Pseudoalteromonas denitrificans DSM 6059]
MIKKSLLLSLIVLTGCASQSFERAEQNKIIKEYYASVESISKMKLPSKVGEMTTVGGVLGLADNLDGNHQDMISGILAGVLVGAITTSIIEGSNNAFEYQLYSQEKGFFTLIQEEKISFKGGCVKVKETNKVTINSALKINCTQES